MVIIDRIRVMEDQRRSIDRYINNIQVLLNPRTVLTITDQLMENLKESSDFLCPK